ncbi:MAG: hypothetical protein K9G70_06915 [Prolixibacteraceae bacterium]|nr:hypothetical protein [Prolixibacteraceae bacterium]
MRRAIKILSITVASLLVFILLAVSIAVWVVFTPERLTPIVRSQADKMLACQSQIGGVELTFFSTFPQFGLKISDFALINPTPGAQSDTLIAAQQLLAVIDVNAWRKGNEIQVNKLNFVSGEANVFVDSSGVTNYNIYPANPDTLSDDSNAETPLINIDGISIENTNITYTDHAGKLYADVLNLHADISVSMAKNIVHSDVKIHNSIISFAYANEKYLQSASAQFHMLSDFALEKQQLLIDNFEGLINSADLQMSGSIVYDSQSGDTSFGLSYMLNKSPLTKVLELVPPSFQSYYEGIEASGMVKSSGSIIGTYNQDEMPLVEMGVTLENGTMAYAGVPLKLYDVSGDIIFKSDLLTDASTLLQINSFDASTPQSRISTTGMVTQLFSDIHLDLQTDANLSLEEFKPFIPNDMDIEMKGRANGQIASVFTLAQLEDYGLDKMQLQGNITLTTIDAVYDSISLITDHANIDFTLPNRSPQSANTGFASARVSTRNLTSNMPGSFDAMLQNASINIEMSDISDTTRVPDVICSFNIDSLSGTMDTLAIAMEKPIGRLLMSPHVDNTGKINIELAFSSDEMNGHMGKSRANIAKMNVDTRILYDSEQEDIFQQWHPDGFFDLGDGYIALDGYSYPLEIPSIKLNFTPETFNIEESNIILDKSDFQLSGTLINVLSYFRGDSTLRGNFDFTSNTTDVTQLMNLTSGIGYEEGQVENAPADTSCSGPYMVPKGIDLTLDTRVQNASFGSDSATDIRGNVHVYEGILLLDEVKLFTPAARMQLTAMYRTPRKNHLFMGLDYHMIDVEISELLNMIPEVDSLMPMLRSFGGEGEFHLAIETYLDSTYNLKMSTLRGAASVAGQDLVLMDGETFSEIAKKLRFSKQAENRVDSLSAEFTVFRNEIDVYPFLIVMDRYKAIVAGRHNFDMSFDYHISLIDSPLPLKLGVDVKGTLDDMAIRPVRPRYAETYSPAARFAVANKQLELRELIRKSLTEKIEW